MVSGLFNLENLGSGFITRFLIQLLDNDDGANIKQYLQNNPLATSYITNQWNCFKCIKDWAKFLTFLSQSCSEYGKFIFRWVPMVIKNGFFNKIIKFIFPINYAISVFDITILYVTLFWNSNYILIINKKTES